MRLPSGDWRDSTLPAFVDRVEPGAASVFLYALEYADNVSGGDVAGDWLELSQVLLAGPSQGQTFTTAGDFDRIFDSAIDANCLVTPIYAEKPLPIPPGSQVQPGDVLRMTAADALDLCSPGDGATSVTFESSLQETAAFQAWQESLMKGSSNV
jgi:hypothetical protein